MTWWRRILRENARHPIATNQASGPNRGFRQSLKHLTDFTLACRIRDG